MPTIFISLKMLTFGQKRRIISFICVRILCSIFLMIYGTVSVVEFSIRGRNISDFTFPDKSQYRFNTIPNVISQSKSRKKIDDSNDLN